MKSSQEILEYLKVVYAQEVLWHEQLERIYALEDISFEREVLPEPEKPKYGGKAEGLLMIASFLSFPVAFIICAFLLGYVFFSIFGMSSSILAFVLGIGGTGGIIALLFLLYNYANSADNAEKKNRYYALCEEHDKKQQECDRAFDKKCAQKDFLLRELKKNADECRTVLDMLYEDGTIYKDFRNIVAVSALLSYFEAGRFRELGDAYNQFAIEYRLDRIEGRIDDISNKISRLLDKFDRLSNDFREYWIENMNQNKAFRRKVIDGINAISTTQGSIINNQLVQNEKLNVIAKNTDTLKYITNYQQRHIDIGKLAMKYEELEI